MPLAARAPAGNAADCGPLVIENRDVRRVEAALDGIAGYDAALALRRHQRDHLAVAAVEKDLEVGADEEDVLHPRRYRDPASRLVVLADPQALAAERELRASGLGRLSQ